MKVLRMGDRGPTVSYLQLALARAGFGPGPLDGVFGPRTRRALTAFQASRRLIVDGVAGPLTWQALLPYLKGYVHHTIRGGDTLYQLSKLYGTTVHALLTANPGLVPEALMPGQRIVVPLGFPVVPHNVPYSSMLLSLVADGLTARYPQIESQRIGKSVLGQPLTILRFGRGDTEVFFNASHHANEWITTPVVLTFLEQYAGAVASGGSIYDLPAEALAEAVSLIIAPMVNPDGVDLVTGYLDQSNPAYASAVSIADRFPSIPFPGGWKANLRGVDLNLNYPAEWATAREIKFSQGYTRPAPRDYVGASPLSEPESRALHALSLRHPFTLTLSYHAQGEVIFWQFMDYQVPGAEEIGKQLSYASGYPLESTPYNSSFAGYKDWFIQTFLRPSYTIEVGRGVSPLPLAQFAHIYQDNVGLMATALLLAPEVKQKQNAVL